MTPSTEKIHQSPRINKLAKRWIHIIIIFSFVLVLLTARRITLAHGSDVPILGNSLGTPSLTSTATATATSTLEPTSTKTPEPSSNPETTIKVNGTSVNLRAGPGTIFPNIQVLAFGKQLILLGRLSDNSWLFVKTSDGQEGWIKTTSVDITRINLDHYPIKALSPSETTVQIFGASVNLRTGPGTDFSIIRRLKYGELLILLGHLSDDTWLYVKTSAGQEGWIKTTWVDLAGINLEYHAIKTPSPPETTVKVFRTSVNLRTGPDTIYSKIRMLSYGELLTLTGRLSDASWLYVKTSDGQEGWINTPSVDIVGIFIDHNSLPVTTPPPTPTSTPVVLVGIEGRWIDIDLSEQKLYAYEGTTLVASFLVSTGVSAYPTETGQYNIIVKWRYSDMRGFDYYLPDVPYAMYYSGDFSIHGTYWHHNFGTPMSHGCVNMDTRDAEWVYNWASVGTLVNIHI